jgi:hypothetical protein
LPGFQIAMNDAVLMGRLEPFGNLPRDLEHPCERHRRLAATLDHLRQRWSFHELHDQRGSAARLVEAIQLGDVRMIE